MQATPETTTAAERVYTRDWDANGTVSIHMPTAIAEDTLKNRGWHREAKGGWVGPNGYPKFWEADEALRHVITADAITGPAIVAFKHEDEVAGEPVGPVWINDQTIGWLVLGAAQRLAATLDTTLTEA